ncbi:hypothetical protein M0805_007910 [Coniferiporia weirii]|nr:hypothetical protein M0805_007910 [Coniferiporia weirii]
MNDSSTRLQIPDASAAGPSQSSRSVGSGSNNGAGSASARPASAQVYPTSAPHSAPVHNGSQASRKRASHQVVTSQPEREEQVGYRDVYSHPAAVAYAAAHPRRSIPKFGPYLLLQTLGEGEFGKVKLGLHSQWGEEVAVKLIRRGNIDTAVRMSKVEREIEVLRTIKHPNIVRLYDVIETDKYIGIILEYASGGELFDHILAHRYLKERDACKLFAQLISGVWYIHQKKIVHRDLKLENLLLDRHRNVIITDFGFANRFEHRSDDLMQTSCGSPCYAAPELVISEGLYVGSAVDIWSCGVILYAMLAGYLPFDDDPANPDGDNINLLYRYIVNTPLTFPDYVSSDARDLLSVMLVPDPAHRADLKAIMAHHWLKPYAHLFDRNLQDLERLAMEQHQMKRLAYQRQMKQQAAAAVAEQQKIQRSQSARVDAPPLPSNSQRSRQGTTNQEFLYEANPDESLFSSPAPMPVSRRHPASAVVGHSAPAFDDDDPFGPPPAALQTTDEVTGQSEDTRTRKGSNPASRSSRKQPPPVAAAVAPVKTSPERRKTDRQRHTIQLEYGGEPQEDIRPTQPLPAKPKQKTKGQAIYEPKPQADIDMDVDAEDMGSAVSVNDAVIPGDAMLSSFEQPETFNTAPKGSSTPKALKPLPSPPVPSSNGNATPKKYSSMQISNSQQESSSSAPSDTESMQPPILSVTPTSPPRNEVVSPSVHEVANGVNGTRSAKTGGTGSSKSRHRKGMSVDKFVGKLWGTVSDNEGGAYANVKARRPSDASITPTGTTRSPPSSMGSKWPSMLEVSGKATPSASPDSKASDHSVKNSEAKKSRRNTLTIMVEPLSKRISQRSKSRPGAGDTTPVAATRREKEKSIVPPVAAAKMNGKGEDDISSTPQFPSADVSGDIPASTSKASKVMQWFRYKSKSRAPSPTGDAAGDYEDANNSDRAPTPTAESEKRAMRASLTKRVEQKPIAGGYVSETPRGKVGRAPILGRGTTSHVSESSVAAAATHHDTFMGRLSTRTYNKAAIRPHHGAVDQTTVTTGSPPEVMAHVTKVLLDMGLEVQQENEYKYRCIRTKRKKAGPGAAAGGLTAFTMVGSAASNGIDKRGLPMPSQSSFSSTGGMLKGLLMRRQSSQVSAHPSFEGDSNGDMRDVSNSSREKLPVMPAPPQHEPIYGDRTVDQADEVRFSVELTRIDGLDDTFSIDIRRLKGHLRSYKFLYDTLRE